MVKMSEESNHPINQKLEEATHYILSKCSGKSTFTKTVLFKLLYFSDFNFFKKNHKSITGESYRKLDYGPAPSHFSEIIDSLVKSGKVKSMVNVEGVSRYKVLSSPEIKYLGDEEVDMINKVIEKVGHCTATEISKLSHEDTPWQVTGDKEIIEYNLVFYRDESVAKKLE